MSVKAYTIFSQAMVLIIKFIRLDNSYSCKSFWQSRHGAGKSSLALVLNYEVRSSLYHKLQLGNER